MSGSDLFRELRRRHIWRVAVAYVVTGWLLVQLASIALPAFGAPPWTLRVVLGLVALFLPVALLLAWAYEITPEGVRRTVPAGDARARPPEERRRVGRTLSYATVAALAAAAGMLAWRQFATPRSGPSREAAGSGASAASAAFDSIPARSIAVLPFESLSADSANAYFASGMQDMILTKLAGLGDIRVISRTSTERYASQPEDLRTIGQELGVATVLEGSVQRAGKQVLINLQLIDARTNDHLWAEYYTRTLDNVFGVEGEVATRVADALQARLTPTERQRVAAPPTMNAGAYDLYLRADLHLRRAYDDNTLVTQEVPPAIPLLRQALERDPGFALAAAGLARAHMLLYFFAPDRTEARLAAARAAADSALALQPDLGEGHRARALIAYWGHRDYAGAIHELELARRSLPNSVDVELLLAAVERRQGDLRKAADGFRRAALLDPRQPGPLYQLALTDRLLRLYRAADSAMARVQVVDPSLLSVRSDRSWNAAFATGDLEPVRSALAAEAPGSEVYRTSGMDRYYLAWFEHDFPRAVEAAREDTAREWNTASNVVLPRLVFLARAQAAAGRADAARETWTEVRSRARAALGRSSGDADVHLTLALADAGLGRKEEAVAEGRRAAELLPVSRDAVTGPAILTWLAEIYVRVGQKRQAIELLHRLMDMPAGMTVSKGLLKLEPSWDPLRDEPEFRALLRDPGFPPASAEAHETS